MTDSMDRFLSFVLPLLDSHLTAQGIIDLWRSVQKECRSHD